MAIFSCTKQEAPIEQQIEKGNISIESMASNLLRPNLIFEETFEGASFFPIRGGDSNMVSSVENCGTNWTLSRVTSPVFQDSQSVRFEIRDDQPLVGSGDKVRSESTIIRGADDPRFTPEMWYSFAVLFPSTGLEFDKTRDCFSQWYENGGDETTLRIEMDRAYLEVCPPEGSTIMKQYDLFSPGFSGEGTPASFVPIPKDEWHEFVFHIKHATGDDGFIEVWRDGTKIHHITGRNIHQEMPKWKLGLYKIAFLDESSPWDSRVIYFDNIRVGNAQSSVEEMSSGLPPVSRSIGLNQAPHVDAGPDTAVILPLSSLFLTGNVFDTDGSVSSVKWSQVSGPEGIIMIGDSTLSLKLKNLKYGNYVFRLTVTDDMGGIAEDDIAVTVTSSVNVLPIANAGPDQIVFGTTTTLDGSKSVDPDGSINSYQWSVTSGVWGWKWALSFNTPTAEITEVNGLKPGTYIFKLTVTDNEGAIVTDKVIVTVSTIIPLNVLPVAQAGPDQELTLPGSISLDGSASADTDGSIAHYSWIKVSGPSASILSSSTSTTTVSGFSEGTYVFRLTVTDDQGATAYDDITVTVHPEPVKTPEITGFTLIDAGKEQDMLLITDSAVFNISGLGTTKYNIRANTLDAGSVRFELTGPQTRMFDDNALPFALMSDDGLGNYYYGIWNPPAEGTYTLKATPYSGIKGNGIAGATITIHFSFTYQ